MEQTAMNLGTTKGLTFGELRSRFYAKALTPGKHTFTIQELNLAAPIFKENSNQERVKLVAVVDDETHVRQEELTAIDVDYLLKGAISQRPELGDSDPDTIIATLIKDKSVLDMWFVQNVKQPTYYNWNFREPIKVEDASNIQTVNDLT